MEYYKSQPADIKTKLWDAWETATGRGITGEAEISPLDLLDVAGQLDDLKVRMLLDDYDRKVAGRDMTVDQVLAELDRKLTAALEAGRRGADVLATEEERWKRALPTKHFPGLEPGGFAQQISAKWGEPIPAPLEGVPMSAPPSPWAAYQQGHASMGLEENLPSISGAFAGMPTQPAQPDLTGAYSMYRQIGEDILRKAGYRSSFPGFGG